MSRLIWRISSLSCLALVVVVAVLIRWYMTHPAKIAVLSTIVLSPTVFCFAALLLWMGCKSSWIATTTAEQWPATTLVTVQYTSAGLGSGLITFFSIAALAVASTVAARETVAFQTMLRRCASR
jgi:hypothetical protein